MSDLQRVGEIEVGQDFPFQQREWTVERVGWGLMLLFLLAALTGLFGGGPLSQGSVGEQDEPLQVAYPRFARLKAPTELRVIVGTDAVQNNEARVWLDRAFAESLQIQHVTPEPDRVDVGADRLTYLFQVTDASQPIAIVFFIQPEQVGPLPGRVGSGDARALSFSTFVYP